MLTAKYDVPESQWTAAADAALARWSEFIPADVCFNISISFASDMPFLAMAGPRSWVNVDDNLFITSAAHKIATGVDSGLDIAIIINPTFDWHFGSLDTTPRNEFSLISNLTHELGHGMFMINGPGNIVSPFEQWSADHEDVHGPHLTDSDALMFHLLNRGAVKHITEADLEAASHSGIATIGDDLIFVPTDSTLTFNGQAGDDIVIYGGSLDSFAAELIGMEHLQVSSITEHQENVYRLYEAAFGRDPDLAGYLWWLESGCDLEQMAKSFVASDEFEALYADQDILTGLYLHVLDRAPDAAGYAHWIGQSPDEAWLLTSFALAPENAVEVIGFSLA